MKFRKVMIYIDVNLKSSMDKELYGQYQLTTDEVLIEIRKTDKVLKKFYETLTVLRNHKDKSNSSELHLVLNSLKDFEIPEKE